MNSWPVDEAYIDSVEGSAGGGIIGNPAKYPALGRAILRLHNRRGGETNICTGWHAIEFLLLTSMGGLIVCMSITQVPK